MKENSPRYHLLDWLKILTLLAIQTLHANEFVFFQDNFPIFGESAVWEFMSYYSRIFSLGGQVLVSIIYLLFGLSGKSRLSLLKIAGFALLGQLALTFAFFDKNLLAEVEWDIYFFIAATNLILLGLPRGKLPFLIISVIALIIPPDLWKDLMPEGAIGDILTGRTESSSSGAWALLPWFFMSLLFFNIGDMIRKGVLNLRRWVTAETFVWTVLFVMTLPFLGFYYWTPIGPNYYFFNFHQSSYIFWTNFLPFVFLMRIAFLDVVQNKLSMHAPSRWISSLMWSRELGLTYVTAVLYVGLWSDFEKDFARIPYLFDAFYLSIMPVSEFTVRGVIFIKRKILQKKPASLPGDSSAR